MSRSHGIKGGTADEGLEEQCFLWESWDPAGVEIVGMIIGS